MNRFGGRAEWFHAATVSPGEQMLEALFAARQVQQRWSKRRRLNTRNARMGMPELNAHCAGSGRSGGQRTATPTRLLPGVHDEMPK